jgi:hypothetical protein
MLVRAKVLRVDPEGYSIPSVRFCEVDEEQFVEIQDMIAVENAGVFGELEKVFLFKDDDFTGQFPTLDSIESALEDEHLLDDYSKIDKLLLKRSYMQVIETFPYDFMNLDFCDYYYPAPPDMLRINETIKRVLDWQRRRGDDDAVKDGVEVEDFLLAVTCRHDDAGFPKPAQERLAALIKQNCDTFSDYKARVEKLKGTVKIADWANKETQDFFLAGWPKDIAHSAKEFGWSTTILDYVFYDRTGDSGKTYLMACLIARFSRSKTKPEYLPAALHALDPENRIKIAEIDPASDVGKKLLLDLAEIVAIRNEQAQRKGVVELPDPTAG